MLFAVHKLSLVSTAVGPLLDSMAVLLVVLPVAFVYCTFVADVDSKFTGLVAQPLAFIGISILVYYFASALNAVGLPLALVNAAIGKSLRADSFPLSLHPLSLISAARFESYSRQLLLVLFLNFTSNKLEERVEGRLLFLVD